MPTGPRGDGRPGSVTLIAPAGKDGALAAQGKRLMQARRPRLGATGRVTPDLALEDPAPLGRDEMIVTVCGARMSGLPLNHELTSRRARFVKTARTAPTYALYALPGGPPPRPGLRRSDTGTGASIALELWALPKTAMGDFMAAIPSPLVIGTVELSGGSLVKGFLCEASGLGSAEDITSHGGWRNYTGRDAALMT